MAAIDKIYGTRKQWEELYRFLMVNNPVLTERMYNRPKQSGPISNFTTADDMWLYRECGLEFVQEALQEQYGGKQKLDRLLREWDEAEERRFNTF